MSEILIHIGFPKTGSTLLQSFFDEHPAMHHNRNRFKNYVDTGKITEEVIEELEKGETVDVLSEELLSIWSGDITNVKFHTYNMDYDIDVHQRKTAEDLYRLFPNAKVLIVTRGFQSLFASLYSQYLLTGGTKNSEKFRKESESQILKLYNYNRVIELYEKVFSKEQLIVLPFEALSADSESFLVQLENELGVENVSFKSGIIHGSIPKHLYFSIRSINGIYRKYLSIFSKRSAQPKFERYLEKVYHFKDSKLAKAFIGKKKKFQLSESFVNQFSLNSSKLESLTCFNSYISKYRI